MASPTGVDHGILKNLRLVIDLGKGASMAEQHGTLSERVDASFRRSLATQGKAYADYGVLLRQLAQKEIKATDFGRRALDLYIGAVSSVVSAGVFIVSDTVQTGLDRFSDGQAAAETAVAKATKTPKHTG